MTQEHFNKTLEEFINKQVDILASKRNDYANSDVLSNFKDVASITQTTPAQVVLTLIGVKVA